MKISIVHMLRADFYTVRDKNRVRYNINTTNEVKSKNVNI